MPVARDAKKSKSKLATAIPDQSDLRLGPLDESIGFHLRLANDAAFQSFLARFDNADVRAGDLTILSLVAENPGITQALLSRISRRHMSTLTPVLRELADRGLIKRKQVASDRRSQTIDLTAAGKAALRTLKAAAARHERELARLVGKAGKADFVATLRRISMSMSVARSR
jgi:DNA-binding MarR family transcriptional regulator